MDKETIQKMIQDGIEAYMTRKQFTISNLPNHEHNGTDTKKIQAINVGGFLPLPGTQGGVVDPKVLGDEIVIQGETRNGYGTFSTGNKVQFPIYSIPVIMGGGNTTNETLTGVVSAGATSATLTGAYANPTDIIPTVFSSGEMADVQYTNGSAAISWPAPLTYAATADIVIVGDAVFKGGEAPYGSAIIFSAFDNLYPILYFRVPMEGLIEKWFGVTLDIVAPEYYNSKNAV